jgi:peptidoglycan/LPS O-acetylase OafA/YrhL
MTVVVDHIGVGLSRTNGTYAAYAVICFFVLSGFLITHLLLGEHAKTGNVSLRKFYLRRALRIFPAFYGYAIIYVIGRILLTLPIHWPSLISCLTYTTNYYGAFYEEVPQTMVHVWSLAVEEQFYLLWPFIFWKLAGNRMWLMKGLSVAILVIWAYRWAAVLLNFPGTYVYEAFETRADALAIGCLLAIANWENRIPRWLVDWKWLGPAGLAAIIVSAALVLNGPRYAWALVAVAFAILILQAIAHSQSPFYKWLNSWPLYALGVVSYSLYLYHPFANRLPSALRSFPIEIVFAIALATASYFIVEKPFLRLKSKVRFG